MEKSLIDLIDSYEHLISSLGLYKVPADRSGEIKFEGGGWVLAFIADRYYSNGLIISLVELGSKEYSLSILMDSVKEFESEITKVLNERAEDYVVNTENQPERLESIEERTTDLIKFLVEKFLIFRKNQKSIDKIYDRLAKSKLEEIGLRFIDE
jgi:hypothetical protein